MQDQVNIKSQILPLKAPLCPQTTAALVATGLQCLSCARVHVKLEVVLPMEAKNFPPQKNQHDVSNSIVQKPLSFKSTLAHLAAVLRLLTCVDMQVNLEVVFAAKVVIISRINMANMSHEISNSTVVRSPLSFQSTLAHLAAVVGRLGCVDVQVELEVVLAVKALPALVTPIAPLARVRALVSLEVPLLREALAAQSALVGSFAGVNSLVRA